MIERNDLFDYGYYIYQNSNYFKFSIDSILLAEFIKVKNNQKILDLCTGNAPIPMILTTKNNTLDITAIEIQKGIYDLAEKSIIENNLSNIKLINSDAKGYKGDQKFDIVICNPPYFKVDEKSELNESIEKRIARHEVAITLPDIIECAYSNLKETGWFYIVHRSDRLIDVINKLETKKFGIRRITFISTNNDTKCELFLLEASKNKKSDPKITTINVKNLKTYKNIFKEV